MSSAPRDDLLEALKDVFDPELGYNIVDLGLVYGVDIDGSTAKVTMTLTTPGCPASDVIQGGVEQRLLDVAGIGRVDIDLVWEPAWGPHAMSPQAKQHFGVQG
ncbi:MAG: metal-sulfur cluster assembly factor [Rubrivivax sp.]|nr:metal-sulfur cluster assembly factor [Rubrivivax sp.]